ncbi:MAG: PhoPQ-activated pathogenicity-related protein [Chthonomonadaceae bacterium]|nr:PhoPQ-activated pathogenicity-related protein [Chthonomonadaceae bacterium]
MSLPTELSDYVERPDNAYRYTILAEEQLGRGILYDLELISQMWQGIPWRHRLQVFVPEEATVADIALLTIGADFGNPDYHRGVGDLYTEATGLICAFLFDVPNQPLFEGKVEDEIIAYTLAQCLDTGDMDWPLLLPMTRSAVRAMDAVQALLHEKGRFAPQRFVVSGMSKRGWTTWLAAVADSRVAGIIPMVYDNLNLFAQMPHQHEVWTEYSEQISDYTQYDLQARMQTPEGHCLAQIIDPYTYRDNLTLPKLIMNGANDRYWATDALNLYWDGLSGPKHVLYIPNSGHSLNDPQRVWSAALAFVHAVAAGTSLPSLEWEFQETVSELQVIVQMETPASAARLWLAFSETLDFRTCVWESIPLALTSEGCTAAIPLPQSGCLAVFGEIEFTPPDASTYALSTQMRIVDRRATP